LTMTTGRLFMDCGTCALNWAQQQFGRADLSDLRLQKD